jgi:hypothetical protein
MALTLADRLRELPQFCTLDGRRRAHRGLAGQRHPSSGLVFEQHAPAGLYAVMAGERAYRGRSSARHAAQACSVCRR